MAESLLRLLVIAGSDSSGGAGIHADLKTAQAFGVYAQTAITAVTVQDTNGVASVNPVTPNIVRDQIRAALKDIGADAIKIGMLGNGEIAGAVADALEGCAIPLVLDTVLLSSSGAALLDEAGIAVLKDRLMRRAALVTPNLPEAEVLAGMRVAEPEDMEEAARRIHLMGPRYVLVKGGHLKGDATDLLWNGREFTRFSTPRIDSQNTHGTGCTFSAAIAAGLARGQALGDAIRSAKAYVTRAIREGFKAGRGVGQLRHFIPDW